ncbi:hypothetical protein BC567DRAFT_213332 [Phyllosticta citribraziliensis]
MDEPDFDEEMEFMPTALAPAGYKTSITTQPEPSEDLQDAAYQPGRARNIDNPLIIQLAEQMDKQDEKITRLEQENADSKRLSAEFEGSAASFKQSTNIWRNKSRSMGQLNAGLKRTINRLTEELDSTKEQLEAATTKLENHMQEVKRELKRDLKRKFDQMVDDAMQSSAECPKTEPDTS